MSNLHEKVARTLSRNYDITVIFQGTQPCTDGKKIILPALPEDALKDPETIKLLRGYVDHEVGHVRHSVFYTINEFREMGAGSERIRLLANQFEDFRIEKLQADEYFGVRQNLTDLANIGFRENSAGVENPLTKLWSEARRQCCGFDLEAPDFSAECKAALGADIFKRISNLKNTPDAIELAKAILKDIDSSKSDGEGAETDDGGEGEKSDSDQGQGGERSRDNQADKKKIRIEGAIEDNGGDESGDNTENESGDGFESGDNAGDEAGDEAEADTENDGGDEGDSGSAAGDSGSGGQDEVGQDVGEQQPVAVEKVQHGDITITKNDIDSYIDNSIRIRERLTDLCTGLLGGGSYAPYSTAADIIGVPFNPCRPGHCRSGRGTASRKPPEVVEAACLKEYDSMLKALGALNTMRSKFTNLFKTDTKKAWLQGKDKGKLNPRALSSVATGNKKVFKEKFQKRDTDTAVTILVDWSGSMLSRLHWREHYKTQYGAPKLRVAMESTVMFTELLTGLGIKHEILAFTTGDMDARPEREDYQLFGRLESLIVWQLKAFDEPLGKKVKLRIGGYGYANQIQNADGESLQIAYDRIKVRPEKRRILLVLSDGDIAVDGSRAIYEKHFEGVVKRINLEKQVELFAIGFDSHDVERYYPRQHMIIKGKDAQNLPEVLFNTLQAFLLKNLKRR